MSSEIIPIGDTGKVFVGVGTTGKKEINATIYEVERQELQNKVTLYERKHELIRHHATAARRYFEEGDDDGAMKELEMLLKEIGE